MAELGVIYDSVTAIGFAAQKAGLLGEAVGRVLRARDALQDVFGLTSEPADGVDVEALRIKYKDLLRPEVIANRFISYELEATFIQLETGLSPKTITAVLAADTDYMLRLGLVDHERVSS